MVTLSLLLVVVSVDKQGNHGDTHVMSTLQCSLTVAPRKPHPSDLFTNKIVFDKTIDLKRAAVSFPRFGLLKHLFFMEQLQTVCGL